MGNLFIDRFTRSSAEAAPYFLENHSSPDGSIWESLTSYQSVISPDGNVAYSLSGPQDDTSIYLNSKTFSDPDYDASIVIRTIQNSEENYFSVGGRYSGGSGIIGQIDITGQVAAIERFTLNNDGSTTYTRLATLVLQNPLAIGGDYQLTIAFRGGTAKLYLQDYSTGRYCDAFGELTSLSRVECLSIDTVDEPADSQAFLTTYSYGATQAVISSFSVDEPSPLETSPTTLQYSSLDYGLANTNKNLAAPEDPNDAARLIDIILAKSTLRAYADESALRTENALRDAIQALEQGLELKNNARLGSFSNVDISEITPVIDGVQTSIGDRIALLGQTDVTQNGLYVVTTNGLVRSADADTSEKLRPGTAFRVSEGSLADRLFVLVNDSNVTIGSDPINFVDQTPLIAQAGLGLSYDANSNSYNVGGTPGRILVSGRTVDIDPAYDQNVANQVSAATIGLDSRLTAIESANYITVPDAQLLVSGALTPIANRVSDIENAGYQTSAQVNGAISSALSSVEARVGVLENAGYQTASQVLSTTNALLVPATSRISTLESAGYQTASQVQAITTGLLAPFDVRLTAVENAGYQTAAQVSQTAASLLVPVNARLTTIENAGYQTASQVQSSIDTAIATYRDLREQVILLANGVITRTSMVFTVAHNLNSQRVVGHIRVLGTNQIISSGHFGLNATSLSEVTVSLSSFALPANQTLELLLQKIGA